MGARSAILHRERVATPSMQYEATLQNIVAVVDKLETAAGRKGLPVGIGHPGAISPATG